MARIGLEFEAISPDIDETRHPEEAPTSYVERVARAKAQKVSSADNIVIAADTVVVHEGVVLGKPAHPAEARSMLLRIQDDVHHVITGVAVAGPDGIVSDIDTTTVHMV
ncbi:MAG: septum formation inhibitor Maf, partial [Acidimicrobiia bacterium]|nr:septum formation inhibitor Maf [Acidimicrobiia bacterium]